jgi:hypothetical protein
MANCDSCLHCTPAAFWNTCKKRDDQHCQTVEAECRLWEMCSITVIDVDTFLFMWSQQREPVPLAVVKMY